MAKRLPYRATTATGSVYDVDFPLHPNTGSAVRVNQLLSAVLETLDREIGLDSNTSNGDVLQAVAMALAIRTRVIEADEATARQLVADLVVSSLEAVEGAGVTVPTTGHA